MQEFRDIPRGFPSPGGAGLDKASKASRPDLGVYLWPGWAGGLGRPGYREWASGGPKCPEFCSEWPHTAGYRHLPPTTLRDPARGSSWGRRISAQRGLVVPGLPLESPCPGALPRLCFHRVLGCTPFITTAYFLLWFLPPFTSLRGLWYTTFYSLFQALATVSKWLPCPGPGLREPQRGPLATVKSVWRGEGRCPGGPHCWHLLTPPALRPFLWATGDQPGSASLLQGPAWAWGLWSRAPRGCVWAAGASLSPAWAPSSSRCPTRRSPCS